MMDEDDKKRLRGNYTLIEQELDVNQVKSYLFQEGILTDEDMEYINIIARNITPQEASRRLYSTLLKRGDKAYPAFLNALQATEMYDHIYTAIINTDPSKVHSPQVVLHEDSDYTKKMNMLQNQVLLQSSIMYNLQQEMEALKKGIQAKEAEEEALRVKYLEFDRSMTEYGLTNEETVEVLKMFIKSRSTKSTEERESSPDEGDTCVSGSLRTRDIAIDLGIDIVEYLTAYETQAPPPKTVYAQTLRRTASEVNKHHCETFNSFIDKLEIDQMNGYHTLKDIADIVCKEGNMNWGRIVVVYTFGGWVGRNAVTKQQPDLAKFVGEFLGFYISHFHGKWIDQHGGWDGFVKHFPEQSKSGENRTPQLIAAALAFGALSAWYFNQR